MGNTTIQRILSQNQEELDSIWNEALNSSFGSNLFFSIHNKEKMDKIVSYENEDVKKMLKSKKPKEKFSEENSQIEQNFDEVRPLVDSRALTSGFGFKKNFSKIWDFKVLQNLEKSTVFDQIEDYRRQICYLIHIWISYNKNSIKNDELKKNFVFHILEDFKTRYDENDQKTKTYVDDLMVVTFGIYSEVFLKKLEKFKILKNFENAKKNNSKEILKNLKGQETSITDMGESELSFSEEIEKLEKIIACFEENKKQSNEIFHEDSTISLKLRKKFRKLALGLIKFLKNSSSEISKNHLNELMNLTVNITFKLASIQIHLLLLATIKDLDFEISELPESLKEKNLINLPIIFANKHSSDRQEFEIVLDKIFSDQEQFKVEDLFKKTPILIPMNNHFVLESHYPSIYSILSKETDCSKIHIIEGKYISSGEDVHEIYKWNSGSNHTKLKKGKIYGCRGSDVGEFNANELVFMDNLNSRIDRYWSIRSYSYLDELTTSVREEYNVDCSEVLVMFHKDYKHAISFQLYTIGGESEKIKGHDGEKLRFMITNIFYERPTSGRWYDYKRERAVRVGDKVFNPPKEIKDFSNFKPGIIGDFVFMKNLRYMFIVEPETHQLVNFIDFQKNSFNEKMDPILPEIDGFDDEIGEIYSLRNSKLTYHKAEFLTNFNIAMKKKNEIQAKKKPDEKKKETMRIMGVLEIDDSDESSDSSSEEIAENGFMSTRGSQDTDNLFPSLNLEIPQDKILNAKESEKKKIEGKYFYYSYVDFLTRVIYAGKQCERATLLNGGDKNSENSRKMIFDKHRVENNIETYKTFLALIPMLMKELSDENLSLLIYVMKNLENHVEVTSFLQSKNSSEYARQEEPQNEYNFILTQKFLKKILKKISRLDFSDKDIPEQVQIELKKSKNRIVDNVTSMLRKVKNLDWKSEILQLLEGKITPTSRRVYRLARMMDTSEINKILKIPIKDQNQDVIEVLELLFTQIKSLIPQETLILKSLPESRYNINKNLFNEKNKKLKNGIDNWILQKNLKQFFNACLMHFLNYHPDENIEEGKNPSEVFNKNIFEVGNLIKDSLEQILTRIQSQEASFQKKNLIDFDRFFRTSFTGNFISIIVGFNEYLKSNLESKLTPEFGKIKQEIFLKIIKIVKSFGKSINFAKITEEDTILEEKFEIGISSKRVSSFTKTNLKQTLLEKIFKVELDENLKSGLEASNSYIQLFEISKEQVLHNRNIEKFKLIHTWRAENRNSVVEDFSMRCGYCIVTKTVDCKNSNIDEKNLDFEKNNISDFNGKKVEIKLEKSESKSGIVKFVAYKGDWRNKLGIVNLGKICLSNLSQNLILNAKKFAQELKLDQVKNIKKIEKFLNSAFFNYGYNKELMTQFKSDLSYVDRLLEYPKTKETLIAEKYKEIIFKIFKIDQKKEKNLGILIDTLKKRTRMKNMYSRLTDKMGILASKILFLIVLKQLNKLSLISNKFLTNPSEIDKEENNPEMVEMENYWNYSSKTIVILKKMKTVKEIKIFFEKLTFVSFLEPGEFWLSLFRTEHKGDGLSLERSESGILKIEGQRVKNSRKSKNPVEKISELVNGFLLLPVDVESVVKILEFREKNLENQNKIFELFNKLLEFSKSSVLSLQLLSAFSEIFREVNSQNSNLENGILKNQNISSLRFLTVNYNGLSKKKIEKLLESLKEIIRKFVEILCSKKSSYEMKMKVLENLKWEFKGRETSIVMDIDLERIWKNKKSISESEFKKHKKLSDSLLELTEILMRYSARKISESTLNNSDNSLQLTSHSSTIDETSMTNILNKNLNFLISELKSGVDELSKAESCSFGKYLSYSRNRSFGNVAENAASNILNLHSGTTISSALNDYDYRIEKIAKIEKKCFKKISEGNYEEKIVYENIKGVDEKEGEVEKYEINPQLYYKHNGKKVIDQWVNDENWHRTQLKISTTKKILKIIYFSILKIPSVVTVLFSSSRNLLPLFDFIFPEERQTGFVPDLGKIAVNIVSELGKHVNFTFIDYENNFWEDILGKLINNLFEEFKKIQNFEGKSSDYPNLKHFDALKDLTLRLLQGCNNESIHEKMQEIKNSNSTGLILQILNPRARSTCSIFQAKKIEDFKGFKPGSEIRLKNDKRKLSYILLPKSYIFYAQRLSLLNFRERSNGDCLNGSFVNGHDQLVWFKQWPVFDVLNNKINVVHESDIEAFVYRFRQFEGNEEEEVELDDVISLEKILNELGVFESVKKIDFENFEDLKNLAILLELVKDNEIFKIWEKVESVVKKYLGMEEKDGRESLMTDVPTSQLIMMKPLNEGQDNNWKKINPSKSRYNELMSRYKKDNFRGKKSKKNSNSQHKNLLMRSVIPKPYSQHRNTLDTIRCNVTDLNFVNDSPLKIKSSVLKKILKTKISELSQEIEEKYHKMKKSEEYDQLIVLRRLYNFERKEKAIEIQDRETQIDSVILSIEDKEKIIFKILEKNFKFDNEKEIRKALIDWKIIFEVAKNIDNPNFFEAFSEKILVLISQLSEIIIEGQVLPRSNHFGNLIKIIFFNFLNILRALKQAKKTLDYSDYDEEISKILRLFTPQKNFNYENWVIQKDNEEFEHIFNNLVLGIYLFTKGVQKKELFKENPKNYEELEMIRFHFETLKKKEEDLSEDYHLISAYMEDLSELNKQPMLEKYSKEGLMIKLELPYSQPKKMKDVTKEFRNWCIAIKTDPSSEHRFVKLTRDFKGKDMIACCNYQSSESRNIFGNLFEIQIPNLEKNKDFYLTYSQKDNILYKENQILNRNMLYQIINLTKNDDENLYTNPDWNIIKGNYFNKNTSQIGENAHSIIMTGITLASKYSSDLWVYREKNHELGVYDQNYNQRYVNWNFKWDICKGDSQAFRSFDLPINTKIVSIHALPSGNCLVLFEDGNCVQIKKEFMSGVFSRAFPGEKFEDEMFNQLQCSNYRTLVDYQSLRMKLLFYYYSMNDGMRVFYIKKKGKKIFYANKWGASKSNSRIEFKENLKILDVIKFRLRKTDLETECLILKIEIESQTQFWCLSSSEKNLEILQKNFKLKKIQVKSYARLRGANLLKPFVYKIHLKDNKSELLDFTSITQDSVLLMKFREENSYYLKLVADYKMEDPILKVLELKPRIRNGEVELPVQNCNNYIIEGIIESRDPFVEDGGIVDFKKKAQMYSMEENGEEIFLEYPFAGFYCEVTDKIYFKNLDVEDSGELADLDYEKMKLKILTKIEMKRAKKFQRKMAKRVERMKKRKEYVEKKFKKNLGKRQELIQKTGGELWGEDNVKRSLISNLVKKKNKNFLAEMKNTNNEDIPALLLGIGHGVWSKLNKKLNKLNIRRKKKSSKNLAETRERKTDIQKRSEEKKDTLLLGFVFHRSISQNQTYINFENLKDFCKKYLKEEPKYTEIENQEQNQIKNYTFFKPSSDSLREKEFKISRVESKKDDESKNFNINRQSISILIQGKVKEFCFVKSESEVNPPIPDLKVYLVPDFTKFNEEESKIFFEKLRKCGINIDKKKATQYQKFYRSRLTNAHEFSEQSYLPDILQSSEIPRQVRNDVPGNIERSSLQFYFGGTKWILRKFKQFFEYTAFVDDMNWEVDSLAEIKHNLPGAFTACQLRFPCNETIYMTSHRIKGERSSYEQQQMGLLNQHWNGLIQELEPKQMNINRIAMYEITFAGEPGVDAGGLRREYLVLLSKEVMGRFGLFQRSTNGMENMGLEREKFITTSTTLGERELQNFFKLGIVMGQCFQKADILNLNLPSIFWSYLLNKKINWEDYKSVDLLAYNLLENVQKMKDSELEDCFDQNFVTLMSDGTEFELKPGGRYIKVTPENKEEYIALVKERTKAMVMVGFEAIKKGFFGYLYGFNMRFLDPLMLEEKVCGVSYVNLNILRSITKYKNFDEDHPEAKRFWRVLHTFTQKQLSMYLKYVWGRSRLSPGMNDTHVLSYYEAKNGIPEAHTCFFELDLGKYENDEDLRVKLLYGVENCNEIAETGSAYRLDADFGME